MEKKPSAQKKPSPRKERLGEALRKNLLKRKQQVRGREKQDEKKEVRPEEGE